MKDFSYSFILFLSFSSPFPRFTYERSYIEGCLKSKKLSPMTGKNIETQVLGSNYRNGSLQPGPFARNLQQLNL